MAKAIFYKSNGEILCECELDTDEQRVLNRKYGFEALLNKKRGENILQDHVVLQYKKQIIAFLQDLLQNGYLQNDNLPIDDFLYMIADSNVIKCLYDATGINGDRIYHDINRRRGRGCPSACLRYYLKFLDNVLNNSEIMDTTYWIFPSNPKIFDSISEFQKNSMIGWVKNCNAKANDIVFLYITEPTQAIAIQTKVQEVNDKIWLELMRFIEPQIPLKYLQEYAGINGSIQGPQRIKEQKHINFMLNYPQSLNNIQSQKEVITTKNQIPLNQILYGPPGTGKTYNTINKALEILKSYKEINEIPKDRKEQKEIFDEFKVKGQIAFVTFHQSYSYEEFVEGIKPNINIDSNIADSKTMEYVIKDGIFKEICKRAQYITKTLKDSKEIEINEHTKVWKMSLGDQGEIWEKLRQHCYENNEIRIGFDGEDDKRSVPHFVNDMKPNDIVCILYNIETISLVGVILGEVCEDEGVEELAFKRFRKVKWLNTLDDPKIPVSSLNNGIRLARQTVYELKNIKPIKLLELIGKNNEEFTTIEDNTQKPYILIIDEINRGNISNILGELITLIESSKRIGENEALEVKLPYSQESFGVPKNLYIIGTMNTADRSIAMLDTALRRRFDFIEMMPNPHELKNIYCDNVEINLQKILEKMNNRIEFLLDRERTIGHVFFIDIKNIDDLKAVFKNKILPLLQEYFHDDYAKIDAVLNYNKMIESKTMADRKIFLSDEFIDSEKKVYEITEISTWKKENFIKIYNDSIQIESSIQDKNKE